MTAQEAVTYGLAKGLVNDVGSLGEKLGMAKWQGVGSPATVSPSGTKTEALATLHELLQAKATALKLGDPSLTQLQKEKAAADWKEWLGQECLGKKLQWTMILLDAMTNKARAGGYGSTSGYQPGSFEYEYAKMHIDSLRKELREEQNSKAANPKYFRQWRLDMLEKVVSAREAEMEFSLKAVGQDNAGGIIVTAWVHKSAGDDVASVPKNGPIALVGVITDIDVSIAKGGILSAKVVVDRCTFSDPLGKKTEPPSQEELAERRLNIVTNFKKNGMDAKARETLESILKDFPNTKAAEKARKELEGPK
jgi:hypothetical protein